MEKEEGQIEASLLWAPSGAARNPVTQVWVGVRQQPAALFLGGPTDPAYKRLPTLDSRSLGPFFSPGLETVCLWLRV